MRAPRLHGPRDQDVSVFSSILLRLCEASGALSAALVDAVGETVDYAGSLRPYDAKVAAAEWRIVLSLLEVASEPWAATHELVIRAGSRSYAASRLSEGYALVLVLPRGAFRVSRRALAEAVEGLEREAGLRGAAPREKLAWTYVLVREARREKHRPDSIWHESAWRPVTVLGRFERQGLEAREIGYLARFATGPELFLVREPLGKWFLGRPT